MKNRAENMLKNLVPDPFLNFENNTKQLSHARNYFKNKIFRKKIIKKSLKSKLYNFFNAVAFKGQDYKKQKVPRNSEQLLFRL